ncbi:MAG: signal transduction histidine kinase [Verrucomicrobiales bacterium]|jgi:signal transduction histidine kinase
MNLDSEKVLLAFREHERAEGIRRARIACVLVIVLMPAGAVLDAAVYTHHFSTFLALRIVSSGAAALVYLGLKSHRFQSAHGYLSAGWYLIPCVGISMMIGLTEGFVSPYYAGLNLVALCAAVVLQVTVRQSIGVILAVLLTYGIASGYTVYAHGGWPDWRLVVNNLYFLVTTAIVVVTGSAIVGRMRFREFELRYALNEKGAELESSNEKLRALDEAKSRFFANISHELRTPLTLLLSPLESELGRSDASQDEETRNALKMMRDNGLRLLRLINDLLDLVKLDQTEMRLLPRLLQMPQFLSGMVSAVAGVARDKRIELRTEIADTLDTHCVDQEKLEKVLLNLLFNALKFTLPGGVVTLRARSEEGFLCIQVVDTGIGISAEDLPKLFHRFWQADDSSQRKYQGTGIGLSLAGELVDLHGGTIEVESELGRGTCMSIRIPPITESVIAADTEFTELVTTASVAESDLRRRAAAFSSIGTLEDNRPSNVVDSGISDRRPTILIADDERDMLEFLAGQLSDDYRVVKAADGADALELGKNGFPDAIILDGMMPEMDGFEVCRKLRAHTSTRSTPIIMLTARADEATKFKALDAGATDFLTKPFSLSEVKSRLRNLVNGYQFQKELALKNTLLENAIESLKETREQLAQSEKLASLGQMSAGIIHEINNPLNFVKTSLYTLGKLGASLNPNEVERYRQVCDTIGNGVERIEKIVSELRLFAHENSESIHDISVLDCVLTAQRFCAHDLDGRNVEVEIPADHFVLGNSHKLMQVFLNLLQNAAHATAGMKAPTIRVSSRLVDDDCVVTVSDKGVGIPGENLNKVFDPFFTTKDVGKGMGMGLSFCHTTITSWGGRISASSTPGNGTAMILTLRTSRSDNGKS